MYNPYAFEGFSVMEPPFNPYANYNIMGLDDLWAKNLLASQPSFNPMPYLGTANFLLNPPQGPQDMTVVGSPTQGNEPIVASTAPWGGTAASGALQGVMAGAPFGPWGMAGGSLLGYSGGKK